MKTATFVAYSDPHASQISLDNSASKRELRHGCRHVIFPRCRQIFPACRLETVRPIAWRRVTLSLYPSWSAPTTRWHSRTSARAMRKVSGGLSWRSTKVSPSQPTNRLISTALSCL